MAGDDGIRNLFIELDYNGKNSAGNIKTRKTLQINTKTNHIPIPFRKKANTTYYSSQNNANSVKEVKNANESIFRVASEEIISTPSDQSVKNYLDYNLFKSLTWVFDIE